ADVALSPDDALVARVAAAVGDAIGGAPPEGAAWPAERAALSAAIELSLRGPPPPSLESLLVRRLGGLSALAFAIERDLAAASSVEDFDRRVAVENRALAYDANLMLRLRARRWLGARRLTSEPPLAALEGAPEGDVHEP